ncbi:MAG: glycosyl transferase, group 2 family protein [Candidatus Paceibacter sp.]|jgi:dolichol-phosphate mannosyltransferase|nr:glycosyl transferase, group 2 family protein [Candidatus Paceibacter sp.]
MPKILIIIPTYNESENIVKLIDALFAENLNADILVVDDSSDNTAEFVRARQKDEPRLFIIKRTQKGGRGSAVMEGFAFGMERDYTRIVEMDADFSHDPRELKTLLAASADDTLVIGSRYLKDSKILNWPLTRRIFSKCANFYANMILHIGIHDYTNGYRVYGREALKKLEPEKIKGQGYIVLSEISFQLFRKDVKFVEVPTVFVNRRRGASNFSLKEIREAFLSVLRVRFNRVK